MELAPDAPEGLCTKCLLQQGLMGRGGEGLLNGEPEAEEPAEDPQSFHATGETPGRYTQEREYARGGMGRILIAHDEQLGRDIAMKELLPKEQAPAADGRPSPVRASVPLMARFLQEARITGQLEHAGIVPVYELGYRQDGTLYYTMKLVRGKTLSKAIKEGKTLRDRLGLLFHFADLCNAIAYAHSRGVIHRDIKPANVMVGEFGETVVLDWGLAKTVGKEDVHADGMTKTLHAMRLGDESEIAKTQYGQTLGTPAYLSPEQARGQLDQVDERSDVYSLGAVLYEILTGDVPFSGKSVREVLDNVINKDVTPVSDHEPNVPPELAAICERALLKNPQQRYASAKDLAAEIERFQSGAIVQAHEYTFAEHCRRIITRHKPIVVTVAVAALALITLVTGAYVRIAREKEQVTVQRDEAQRQREEADQQRQLAEEERSRTRKQLYVSSIFQARLHLDSGQYGLARESLWQAPLERRGWEWGNLADQMYPAKAILQGHEDGVLGAWFSADGTRILTSSWDYTARVWDAQSGRELHVLEGHEGALWSASDSTAFSSDDTRIVTASDDGTARVWDAASGEMLHVLSGHSEAVHDATFSADGTRIVTASWDNTARVWDAASGQELHVLSGHRDHVESATFSPDGTRILTASEDHTARVWDAASGEMLVVLSGHEGGVSSASFGPDGTRIVTVSGDETARVWDAASGQVLHVLSVHRGRVRSASFSPYGTRFLTASDDGTVRVWDAQSGGQALHVLSGHEGGVWSASFSPDGNGIITWSEDATARVWDAQSGGQALHVLSDHGEPVENAAYSADGTRIVTASWDNTARVWDAQSGQVLHLLEGHENRVYSATFSPDGSRIVTASEDSTARVWDAASGEELCVLSGHRGVVESASFGPDGTRIVTASGDETARVWDAASGQVLHVLSGHRGSVLSATFSPDGTRIVTASNQGTPRMWDAASGEMLGVLSGYSGSVKSATFSPDGTRIVTASSDRTARVWDAASGEMLGVLSGHENRVSSVSFSPDGTRIVTASKDGTARVWDTAPWHLDDPRLPEVEGEFATPEEEHKARFFEWKRQRYEEWMKASTQTLETLTTEASVTQAGDGDG